MAPIPDRIAAEHGYYVNTCKCGHVTNNPTDKTRHIAQATLNKKDTP